LRRGLGNLFEKTDHRMLIEPAGLQIGISPRPHFKQTAPAAMYLASIEYLLTGDGNTDAHFHFRRCCNCQPPRSYVLQGLVATKA
jgi:hypothetical protein